MQRFERYDTLFQWYAPPAIDWRWLRAQARAESGSSIDPRAVSPVGARGLAQFMPATFAEWADGLDPFNPEDAIKTQADYMAWLCDYFDDDLVAATAAYNWGCGNLARAISNHGPADYREHLPHETRTYLDRIEHYYKQED